MPPRVSMLNKESKMLMTSLSRVSEAKGTRKSVAESIAAGADKENLARNGACVGFGSQVSVPPSPVEFDQFFPWLCRKMAVDGDILIIKKVLEKYIKKSKKRADFVDGESKMTQTELKSESGWQSGWQAVSLRGRRVIPVLAASDARGTLLELRVSDSHFLTQQHFKVLQICLPFQPGLAKIVLIKCRLNQESIYEIAQLLKPSRSLITELILDDTICKHGNFYTLLEYTNNLKNLSLNRCNINDTIMIELFKRVREPLQILELSSNYITDKSIHKVAKVLRTNRSLIHLNLAGNSISDDGISSIMNTLKKFKLTKNEILEFRIRKLQYCETRRICFEEQLKQAEARSLVSPTKRNVRHQQLRAASARTLDGAGRKGDGAHAHSAAAVAEKMTRHIMGTFADVFDKNHVDIENDRIYCHGNFKISSLNFAYNDMSHIGMKSILKVLEYQNSPLIHTNAGLVRIVVNGNNLCDNCDVQKEISDHINKKMSKIVIPVKPVKKTVDVNLHAFA